MSRRPSDFELRHLRAFAEVARTLHFGRAATNLHMSQSALSYQVAQLEKALGVTLVERTSRRVALTAAGTHLAHRSQRLVPEIESLADEVRAIADGRAGRLRIAAAGSLTLGLLPAALHLLRDRVGDVEIGVRGELLTDAQVAALHRDEIDVGLLRPPVPSADDLTVDIVGHEPFACAVPETHRLAGRHIIDPAELAGEPLVLYRRGSALRIRTDEVFADARIDPQPVVEAGETSSILSLVAGDIGIGLVPASLGQRRLQGVRYSALDTSVRLGVAIAHRTDARSPLVAAFAAAVHDAMNAGLGGSGATLAR
ncbi:MAG: LysR substrate-binding domain-containing protein [Acidimicrobiales bacterium]